MDTPSENVISSGFAEDVIEHMNTDHSDSLLEYAIAFTSANWAKKVLMTDLQSSGFTLLCQSGSGREESVWISFEPQLTRPQQVRGALVSMAKKARSINGTADQGTDSP